MTHVEAMEVFGFDPMSFGIGWGVCGEGIPPGDGVRPGDLWVCERGIGRNDVARQHSGYRTTRATGEKTPHRYHFFAPVGQTRLVA